MSPGDRKLMPDLCDPQNPFNYTTALNLLMLADVDLHNVRLLPVGDFENYKGEILSQDPPPGTPLKADTPISLRVGSPATFDNLPYQFFYGLAGKREIGATWEENARRLTAMLDSPEIRYNTLALRQLLKFSFAVSDQNQISRFLSLFSLNLREFDSLEEALIWAVLMPTFNHWSGNLEHVINILQKIFGYHFRIVENTKSEFDIPRDIHYRLGSKVGRLGKESVIGKVFVEYDSAYQVIVSGIPRDEIPGFLPKGKKREKVEKVIRLCMPSNLDFHIIFETDKRALNLGDKSYLDYSTRI